MKMEYPSPIEIDREVESICTAALPERESLLAFIRHMTSQLGIRYIFSGIYDVLAFSAVLFAAAVLGITVKTFSAESAGPVLGSALFTLSPIFYMAMFVLSFLKESTMPGLDVKMACKYTVFHLIAYRMLAFSLLSGVSNTVYILILCARLKLPPLYYLCLSLSSLFLFSTLMMACLFRSRSRWAPALLSAAWLAVNLGIWSVFPVPYGAFLLRVPLFVSIPVGTVCAALYVHQIKNLTTNRRPVNALS